VIYAAVTCAASAWSTTTWPRSNSPRLAGTQHHLALAQTRGGSARMTSINDPTRTTPRRAAPMVGERRRWTPRGARGPQWRARGRR
jgi:hypothetical protein